MSTPPTGYPSAVVLVASDNTHFPMPWTDDFGFGNCYADDLGGGAYIILKPNGGNWSLYFSWQWPTPADTQAWDGSLPKGPWNDNGQLGGPANLISVSSPPTITSASFTLTQKKVITFTGLWAVGATTDKTLWHVKQAGITRVVGGVTLTSTTSGEIDMTDYLVLGVPFTVSVEEGGINDTGGDSLAVTETTGTNSSTDVIDATPDVTWVFSNGWNAVLAQGSYLQQLCGATPCEPSPNFPEPAAGGTYIFNVVLASDHATVVATTSRLFGPIGQTARGILQWLKSWLPWL